MKKVLLSLTLCLFFAGGLRAQSDFRPGYVITNDGDTLRGAIDYRGDMRMGEICRFRPDSVAGGSTGTGTAGAAAAGEIVTYTPYDIEAYRFPGSKYFVSREITNKAPDMLDSMDQAGNDKKKAFLEFLVKGQVNIYYLRDNNGERYFVDKQDEPLAELPYEEGIREINGAQYAYKTTVHQEILWYYMQDAPRMEKKISQIDRPDHGNLIELAKTYSEAVCKGDKCVVFERKLPRVGVALDAVGGVTWYYEGTRLAVGGVLVNIWSPRVNEKLYFRTGLLYSKYKYWDDYFGQQKTSIYKIPLMMEYIYPKQTIIRPKAALGWSFYGVGGKGDNLGFALTFTGMAGVNIRLAGRASLSLEYNIDFAHNEYSPLIPGRFFSQAALGGVHFQF